MLLKGKIVKGHGVASGISKTTPYPKGSLEMQFPFFKKMGLDLYQFYMGTLNLDIRPYIWKPIIPDYYLKLLTGPTRFHQRVLCSLSVS